MMNKKNIFIALLSLLILSFVLVQCTKENTNELTTKKIELRSDDCYTNGCDGELINKEVENITLPSGYPGDCKVNGQYLYRKCGTSTFEFYDFLLTIPSTPECSELNTWLQSLSDEDRAQAILVIKNYAQSVAQLMILQDEVNNNPEITEINDVTTYKDNCSQICEYYDMSCLLEKADIGRKEGIDDKGYRGNLETMKNQLELRDVRDPCWKYKSIQCGTGCCITKTNYSVVNGVIIEVSSETNSFGDCSPLPPNPPTRWPRFGPCQWGNYIGDCTQNCAN